MSERTPSEAPESSLEKELRYKSHILCMSCGRVPFITVRKIDPLKLRLVCDFCQIQYKKKYSEIEKESKEPRKEETLGYCFHKGNEKQKNEFYCKDCKVNFCRECRELKKHYDCNTVVDFSELPSKDELMAKVKEAKVYQVSTNRRLKRVCTSKTKDAEKKKQIERIFEKNNEKNNLLFEFVDLILFNYNANDYASIINLESITKFNFTKIYENESVDSILVQVGLHFVVYVDFSECKYPTPKHKMTLVKEIKCKDSLVTLLCIAKDNKIATASVDSVIRIFNPDTGECEASIKEHKSKVNSLISLPSGHLVSCSNDTTLKIYEINNSSCNCIETFTDHTDKVSKLIKLDEELFASCSNDGTIKIWKNISPFECTKTLTSKNDVIKGMVKLKSRNVIVSVSNLEGQIGGKVRFIFWDYKTSSTPETIVNDLIDIDNEKCLLEVQRNFILYCGMISMYIIDSLTAEIVRIIRYFCTSCITTISPRITLTGDGIGRLFSFETEDFQSSTIMKAHDNVVYDIACDSTNKIYTCSTDKTVKIWTFEDC